MRRIRKGTAKAAPFEVEQKALEERLRIAERLVQALREAGYSCALADDSRKFCTPSWHLNLCQRGGSSEQESTSNDYESHHHSEVVVAGQDTVLRI